MPVKKHRSRSRYGLARVFVNKLFIFFALATLALAGGFFYFRFIRPTPPDKWDESPYSPVEEYRVIEIGQRKEVVNQQADIIFTVPQGWTVERGRGASLFLYSPEAQGSTRSSQGLKTGCEIQVETRYLTTDNQTLKQQLKKIHEGGVFSEESYEVVRVDNYEALLNKATLSPLNLSAVGVHIPVNKGLRDRLYFIGLAFPPEQEGCLETFNNFLSSLSIN